jgi:hypothetical protein
LFGVGTTVTGWQFPTVASPETRQLGTKFKAVAVSPGGGLIATTAANDRIELRRLAPTGAAIASLGRGTGDLSFSTGGERLAVVDDNAIVVWDTRAWRGK